MTARNRAAATVIREALGDHPDRGSMTRLAEDVGTTVSTVSRWWSLASSPDPAKWSAIEDALDLQRGFIGERARLHESIIGLGGDTPPEDVIRQLGAVVAEHGLEAGQHLSVRWATSEEGLPHITVYDIGNEVSRLADRVDRLSRAMKELAPAVAELRLRARMDADPAFDAILAEVEVDEVRPPSP